jgi:hypothetical protein
MMATLRERYAERVQREINGDTNITVWAHPRIPRSGLNYEFSRGASVTSVGLGFDCARDPWQRTWSVAVYLGPFYLSLQTERIT